MGKGKIDAHYAHFKIPRRRKKRSFFQPHNSGEENSGGSSFLGEDQAPLTGRSFNGTDGITRVISSNDGEDISDRFKSNGKQ